jgi:hypothetical protein
VRPRRLALGAVILGVLGVWVSPAAAYSSGQFTRAEATSDWSHGSFAGSVTWSDCNAGCKSWLVLVYDEPSVYTCNAEDWLEESDPNIRQVWNSGGQTANKTIPFEVDSVALIPGVFGQRLCMIGVQSTETEYGTHVGQQLVTQALFQLATPPLAPAESTATTPTTTEPATQTPSRVCRLAQKRVGRLRRLRKAAVRQLRRHSDVRHRRNLRKVNKALRRARAKRAAKC